MISAKVEYATQVVDDETNLAELQNFIADNWFPYVEDKEELQNVPVQQQAVPFTVQSLYNYPSLEATPGWMEGNLDQFSNINTVDSPVNENSTTRQPEPSPAPSSTGSFFTDHESMESADKQKSDEHFKKIIARLGVSEKKIQEFKVKELNRFLKSNGLSKDEQRCLKNRRRTLKNRGYAQNCRVKRIKVKKSLESENETLKAEIDEIRKSLEVAKKERDAYKSQLHKIVKFLKSQKKVA